MRKPLVETGRGGCGGGGLWLTGGNRGRLLFLQAVRAPG